MARLLISRGGNVNFVSVPDPKDIKKRLSLLNAAISTRQFELVRFLVENGAYVTRPQNPEGSEDPEGPEEMQPLSLAFGLDDVEMARLLLELGAPKSSLSAGNMATLAASKTANSEEMRALFDM